MVGAPGFELEPACGRLSPQAKSRAESRDLFYSAVSRGSFQKRFATSQFLNGQNGLKRICGRRFAEG